MILWHLGGTLAIGRYVFRDAAMDLRWLALGALLPDLLDKPFGSVLFNDFFGTHRLWSHALVFPITLLLIVMLATSRGSAIRKSLIAVVIGSLVHLILDGAWTDPEAFWWPLFGLEFPAVPDSSIGPLLSRMVQSPLVWAGEVAGLGYLLYLWRRYLSDAGEVRRFVTEGTIPLRTPPPF